ncbi:MAG: AAA family ATPase [Clostridia bacterium]|nr:AAA family ATPase [Clostridia bacterium]MDD4387017.1 AAA family ATPase [Clostridia bacterium]
MNVDESIVSINRVICENISLMTIKDRGFISQNILAQLRNLVEAIAVKIYCVSLQKDLPLSYKESIGVALDYASIRGELSFLIKFHKLLQISVSHYTVTNENAERLLLKYYKYLILLKKYFKNKFNIEILANLSKFPVDLDTSFSEYYKQIAKCVEQTEFNEDSKYIDGRYYVQKIKTFFIEQEVYYEITLSIATDNVSKFNRITVFSKTEILSNYSIKVSLINSKINMFGKETEIKIINNWIVSIRPCEINNFCKIYGKYTEVQNSNTEYRELMSYLSKSNSNLLDIVNLSDDNYSYVKSIIHERSRSKTIFEVLDGCRNIIKYKLPSHNIIRYMLYKLNNKIIKTQHNVEKCNLLSNLSLSIRCKPFDDMPFTASLIGHNPSGYDIFECIEINGKEDELLGRLIQNNTEKECKLYTSISELSEISNVCELIKIYNQKIYPKHREERKLQIENNNIFINGYEKNTIYIMGELLKLSKSGIIGYKNYFEYWLNNTSHSIDCDEKKEILRNIFISSKLAVIYGSAGTGKTRMISHISDCFEDRKRIYLANTNPAIENLKRRANKTNGSFYTIASFLSETNVNIECDLLIIDECSTVSNMLMRKILEKAKFQILVLVGDVYQIESITFGNWFNIARSILPENAKWELFVPYRTKNKELLELWSKVRNIDESIVEYISKKGYSQELNEKLLKKLDDDEIILCLNYDGLYGINSINKYMQNNNENPVVEWGIDTYKVGDPILFNESNRFHPILYNNLKGKIVNINREENLLWFDIEVDKAINGLEILGKGLSIVGEPVDEKTIIRFSVGKFKDSDMDDYDTSNAVMPFVVAYAVSIHKSQGLEYNSVKVILTKEIENMISHNIFYTAITRVKEKLNIYWTPECGNKIIESFNKKLNNKDAYLIKQKMSL